MQRPPSNALSHGSFRAESVVGWLASVTAGDAFDPEPTCGRVICCNAHTALRRSDDAVGGERSRLPAMGQLPQLSLVNRDSHETLVHGSEISGSMRGNQAGGGTIIRKVPWEL